MPDPLTSEPSQFIAGDTVTWLKSLSDYDAAAGWVLTYEFRGNTRKTIVCAPDGADFLATIDAATSATFGAGRYFGFAYVAKAGARYTVWQGQIVVKANPAAGSAAYDGRSHARKCLDSIEAVLEGNATREEADYTISFGGTNRQLRFCPKLELLQMRNYYLAEVRREEKEERLAQGKGSGSRILVRFVE